MPHDEIYRELNECRESGEFVAYHKWGNDPSIFLVGVVLELDGTRAVFRNVDPDGNFEEATFAVPLRLIHTLDRGTRYLWRLKVLQDLGPREAIEERDVRRASEVRALLQDAALRGATVKIWTSAHESSDWRVIGLGEETVAVEGVFDAGPAEGRSVVRLRRIVRARCGKGERDDDRVYRHGMEHGFPAA